jgi:hypothetical protein
MFIYLVLILLTVFLHSFAIHENERVCYIVYAPKIGGSTTAGGVMTKLGLVLAAGFALLIAGGPNARAAHTNCTGSLTATTIDGDVFVAKGANCTLTDVTVDGNVLVFKKASLNVNAGTITGSVHASNCSFVKLSPDSSNVEPIVNGSVHISHCTNSSALPGSGVTAGGEIDGSFICNNNRDSCEVIGATVGNNVQVNHNLSSTASVVSASTIGGNLGCEANRPAPTASGAPNTVTGSKQGQCSAANGF